MEYVSTHKIADYVQIKMIVEMAYYAALISLGIKPKQ